MIFNRRSKALRAIDMKGFIDIHCHFLPGMDDGPLDIDESLEMLEIAAADGVSHIFATPHILDGVYDNSREAIVNSLQAVRDKTTTQIKMFHGADVRVVPDLIKRIEAGHIPTLGDSGYLLVEFPDYCVPPHMDNMFHNLMYRKIIPVITHPERHVLLRNDLKLLGIWRDSGVLVQITALSIMGGFGRTVRKGAFAMIKKGLVDFVASDAHGTKGRKPGLSKAYREVDEEFGTAIADRIFFENPEKISQSIDQEVKAGK